MSGYDLSDCPDLAQFNDLYRPDIADRGPDALRGDLIDTVKEAIDAHPRSAQKEIGPSELGHVCNRWLAHKFAGTPAAGIQAPKWRAAVGTAVHDHFSDYLHRYNAEHGMRWLTDTRVWIGDLYPGRPVTGEMDAYDTWTHTVVDLKVPGPNSMKKHGIGKAENPQYDVQFDSYATGAINAGLPVRYVGALRLPSAGNLADADWKVRPHNPQRAATALLRAGTIARMVDALGPAAIPMQPTAEHYCGTCPFFRPGATDLTTSCPGADTFIDARAKRVDPLTSLIA